MDLANVLPDIHANLHHLQKQTWQYKLGELPAAE